MTSSRPYVATPSAKTSPPPPRPSADLPTDPRTKSSQLISHFVAFTGFLPLVPRLLLLPLLLLIQRNVNGSTERKWRACSCEYRVISLPPPDTVSPRSYSMRSWLLYRLEFSWKLVSRLVYDPSDFMVIYNRKLWVVDFIRKLCLWLLFYGPVLTSLRLFQKQMFWNLSTWSISFSLYS